MSNSVESRAPEPDRVKDHVMQALPHLLIALLLLAWIVVATIAATH
jgi:hypothetical protein